MNTKSHSVKSVNPTNHKVMSLKKILKELMMKVSMFLQEEEDMLEENKLMGTIMRLKKIRC